MLKDLDNIKITVWEAARICSCTRNIIYYKIRSGVYEAEKVDRKYQIKLNSLEPEYIKKYFRQKKEYKQMIEGGSCKRVKKCIFSTKIDKNTYYCPFAECYYLRKRRNKNG